MICRQDAFQGNKSRWELRNQGAEDGLVSNRESQVCREISQEPPFHARVSVIGTMHVNSADCQHAALPAPVFCSIDMHG